MIDGKTWFFGNGSGIFRTTDGGGHWTQVYMGGASGSVYTAKDGSYYVAASFTVVHSSDGVTWTELANSHGGASVNGSNPITSDGTTLYEAQGAYGGQEPDGGWYWSAPLSDPTTWTNVGDAVKLGFGGSNLAYDADHHLLYSSNLTSGFWRLRLPQSATCAALNRMSFARLRERQGARGRGAPGRVRQCRHRAAPGAHVAGQPTRGDR